MEQFKYKFVDYIKENHFNSHKINWTKIYELLKTIKNKKELGELLNKYVLNQLKDNHHSQFRLEENGEIYRKRHELIYKKSHFKPFYKNPEEHFLENPTSKVLSENILYINAPRTWEFSKWNKYFKFIYNKLSDYKKYNGIIFDLSECLGGYYVPIIAPFYLLFGRTIIAHGFNPNNSKQCFTHILKKGNLNDVHSWISDAKYNDEIISDSKGSPIKIGVIISSYTGSAGEFATLFFKNRKNVKIFGERTANMTTWQKLEWLDDKNNLNIGLAYAIDRNGQKYDKHFYIEPDVKTTTPIDDAIKYILS